MSEGQLLHRGVVMATSAPEHYKALISLLEGGFKLDPYFHPNGRPLVIEGQGFVWFTLDEVALDNLEAFNPIAEIPEPESEPREVPMTAAERVLVDLLDVRQVSPENDKDLIEELKKKGYTYTGKWKGLVELSLYQGAQTTGEFVPYCPHCEELTLLTPIGHADAIQGYSCSKCGDTFPVGYDFEKVEPEEDDAK